MTPEFMKYDEALFEKTLLTTISGAIDHQLLIHYSSRKSFWEDMKQDVFLKLWENKKTIIETANQYSTGPMQMRYFSGIIRKLLNRSCRRINSQYDCFNPNVVQAGDLGDFGI